MKHSFSHCMDMDTARRTADAAWESYRMRFESFNPNIEWVGEYRAMIGFSAKGLSLKGELEIKPGRIDIALDVPLIFRILKKRAIEAIEKEIRAWEAKAQGEN
jgi:hypothetical protein